MGRKGKPHENVWLSEREIGDQIWERGLLYEAIPLGEGEWVREPIIANALMPDFVFLGETEDWAAVARGEKDPPRRATIDVAELKITADAFSIVQLVHYANLLQMHGNAWAARHKARAPEVSMTIIARYFDKSCMPFLENPALGISSLRVNVAADRTVSLEYECPDYTFRQEPSFDALLDRLLPVRQVVHG